MIHEALHTFNNVRHWVPVGDRAVPTLHVVTGKERR